MGGNPKVNRQTAAGQKYRFPKTTALLISPVPNARPEPIYSARYFGPVTIKCNVEIVVERQRREPSLVWRLYNMIWLAG